MKMIVVDSWIVKEYAQVIIEKLVILSSWIVQKNTEVLPVLNFRMIKYKA